MKIPVTSNVPRKVAKLIFALLDILEAIGVPIQHETPLRLQRMAEACLAIGQIKTSFAEAKSVKDDVFMRTRDIINYENKFFKENISPGSYDDIRRKDLNHLVLANIAVNSSDIQAKATNDSRRGYCLSDAFAELLRAHGTDTWKANLTKYKRRTAAYLRTVEQKRKIEKVPVTLPSGKRLELSYGDHNQLQKAIIEVFLPSFAQGSDVLYVGDTANKFLHRDDQSLKTLGFFSLEHDELPDVVAYNSDKNLLFLIEAFNCTGQWSQTRLFKIKEKLKDCTATTVYVTAFNSIDVFRSVANNIAWETEVWTADFPEHMIHFNGWKFLELHK